MDRDTKDITIGEHTFKVKSYATAREANAIQQAYFGGAKMDVIGDQPKITDFNPGVMFEVNQEMIRQMVTSMDDSAEQVLDRCLELPNDEFQALVKEVDAIVAKKKN